MDIHQKKQKKVEQGSPNSNEEGDAWTYSCIKRDSYLFVAYSIGKWTQETCIEMIDKAFMRIQLAFPKGKVIDKIKRIIFGNPVDGDIETTNIENFMDRLPKSGTPAMSEKLTNHQWSWDEFFNFQLSILN